MREKTKTVDEETLRENAKQALEAAKAQGNLSAEQKQEIEDAERGIEAAEKE